jgi:tyrocidine synthetase-3
LSGKDLSTLQVITLAGDIVSPRLSELTKQKNKNIELAHEYGVTEAAVMSTLYRHQERDTRITIGRPISNTCIYILDRHHCLQPIGIPGELCIAGAGVARGYLNNPELTAQKFDRDLWDYHDYQDRYHRSHRSYKSYITHRSYRTYRTGDLARWHPDGNIEFLGRIDHQVKIRGIRVELEEIESQLINHENIKDIVVTTGEDKTGNRYLCAYWVPDAADRNPTGEEEVDADMRLTVPDFRGYLSDRLPAAIIPSYFIRVEEIPLTSNGKVDRKALPEPEISTADSYVAPGDEIEKQLAEIWAEVLGIEELKIGIDDNFFELGGHSLLVTLLVLKIEQYFQVKIPFSEVFRIPFIRQLALYVKNTAKDQYRSIEPVEEKEYYPVSAAQNRMFLVNQFKKEDTSDNTPQMIMIEGEPDKLRLERAVEGVIRRHEVLRTSFEIIDDILVQRIHKNMDFKINYPETEENELEEMVKHFIRPFNLEKVPLLRVNLVKLRENSDVPRYIFMYDMHHIICDGLSLGTFGDDIITLYGDGSSLSPLRIQYRDFTLWQNNLLQSEGLERQERYWLEVYQGELPVLDIPIDYPRPAVQRYEGESIYFEFSEELSGQVKKMALKYETTSFLVLLAVFYILLSRYSGQEDIIVGTPIAGRQHADLEKLIGMFVNTLAIRNRPQRDKTFNAFLEEVKTSALGAFDHQDYPFELLVQKLEVKRDVKRHIFFDAMFAGFYPDIKRADRKFEDLVFKNYPFRKETTPFDLVIYAQELDEIILCKLMYSTTLFKRKTMEQMAEHFTTISETVAANPAITLEKITLLSDENRETLMMQSSKEKLKEVEIHFDF